MTSYRVMRTTLNIDDETLELARVYADSRSLSLCKAVSELLRKGLAGPARFKVVNGVAVFDVPPDSPRITTERVKKLESELK